MDGSAFGTGAGENGEGEHAEDGGVEEHQVPDAIADHARNLRRHRDLHTPLHQSAQVPARLTARLTPRPGLASRTFTRGDRWKSRVRRTVDRPAEPYRAGADPPRRHDSNGSPPMRLYAQTPARRNRQVFGDLIAVILVAAAVKFALAVHEAIMLLAEPGRKVESSGDSLATELDNAGDAASRVPLVGDLLKKPLQSAADASTGFADAGQSLQHIVSQVAALTTTALIVIPVAFVLLLWLPPRLRWIRRSISIRRLLDAPGGADLLALRALAGPLGHLDSLPVPPGGLADAWRRGDQQVIADLSEVALRRAGLRP